MSAWNWSGDWELINDTDTGPAWARAAWPPQRMAAISKQSRAP
jgi:hypothetical protein